MSVLGTFLVNYPALVRLQGDAVACPATRIHSDCCCSCPAGGGRVQADAQSKKQQEQLERLRKDMGAVNMQTATPPTGEEA